MMAAIIRGDGTMKLKLGLERVIARRALAAQVTLVALVPFASLAMLAPPAQAQTYPAKPVTLIVPYPPGGATDTLARAIAEKLQARLEQPVVVDNKPGGNTMIGINALRRAAPDGYTLSVMSGQFGQMPIVNPAIAKYDPVSDFTPVAEATSMLMVLVANPALPANSVAELIRYAKANPGKVTVATTGVGSTDHLGGELFAHRTGLKLNFIPYKGGAQAVQDVIGGSVDIRFDAMPSSRQHIETGRLKALAVFEPRRHAAFPAIPAIAESVSGAEFGGYFGVIGPKGLPPAIVTRLNKEITEIMRMPDVVARMSGLGLDPATGSPEQFSTVIKKDFDQWERLIKDTGLKIEQ